MTAIDDDRVLFEVDRDKRIATITLNNPTQRNSYDASMRNLLGRYLDEVAEDDDITVVLLRGAEGVFSTGADMNNAYGWYGGGDERLREEQRTRETQQEPPQPAPPADSRSKVVRLLSQSDGLPEGHGRRDRRLRTRRRLRNGVDDRHLGDRP
jgi:1,4-dihydroxy-2-naphthoyl-CoA synthase